MLEFVRNEGIVYRRRNLRAQGCFRKKKMKEMDGGSTNRRCVNALDKREGQTNMQRQMDKTIGKEIEGQGTGIQ